MGRFASEYITLSNGKRIGYSLPTRGGVFYVRFPQPNGKRVEKTTGRTVLSEAYEEAARIICESYRPAPAATSTNSLQESWKEVLENIEKNELLTEKTRSEYCKVVRAVSKYFSEISSPASLTKHQAEDFIVALGGRFRRSAKQNAASYKRSPNTVRSYLRTLSAVWSKVLHCDNTQNVWKSIKPPTAHKKLRHVPGNDEVEELLKYINDKYAWQLPRLWVLTKCLTGCRSSDICELRSNQLRDGRLFFKASQTKGKADRQILMPPQLYDELCSIAGPTYLWEAYASEVKRYRGGQPGSRPPKSFSPVSLYWTMSNIFREFNDSRPDKPRLTPHGLRRRAITQATLLTGSVDAAAQAIGVDAQTARTHYLDAQKAFNNDEVFKKLASTLPSHNGS